MNIADTPALSQDKDGTLARIYPRGTAIGLHTHREAQLLFSASGIMQVTTPKGRWLVPPDRAVWIPPRLPHAVDVLADVEMRTLLIPTDQLADHPQAPNLAREFVVAVGSLLRQAILASFENGQPDRRRSLLAELALFELAEAEDAATFLPLPIDSRARRVAELVLADPSTALKLADLALAAGASPRTISRLFPAETMLTFKEWRQRARVLAAIEMLAGGNRIVKQVARDLGFSSAAAFGHAFRQVVGITPRQMMARPKRDL